MLFNISRDTEKRQLRAYVGPLMQSSEIKNSAVSATVSFENFGETPARNCSVTSHFDILPFPLPKGFIFKIPDRVPYQFKQTAMIYPKASIPKAIEPTRTFTASELVEVTAPNTQRAVYFFGIFTYTDVFDAIHSTKFCYYLNPYGITVVSKNKSGIVGTYKWTECDQYNDFD